MNWRAVREADLTECLGIEPRHLGDDIVGRERALAIWSELARSRYFNSVVLEADTPVAADRIVGFGASVFVTSDFATQELQHPRPGLTDRVIASIAAGRSVVRPESELGNAGADNALDVVILGGCWLGECLSPEQVAEAQMLLAYIFVEHHVGYRLNRLLQETIGEPERRYLESSGGVWRAVESFAGERSLFVMTKDASSVSGSLAASLFQYKAPVLHLRDTDKHLLAEALNGGTDGELAARINLSPSSIKKRWHALFERVADVRPDLLPVGDDKGRDESRGPQKRHHILAYVRSHPEELRPFKWHTSGGR